MPVDGRLVVTRTRDGGATWTKLTNGLPQRYCYDIVYRHALAIDATGECLAMGSTTAGCGSPRMAATHGRNCRCACPPCIA